MLIQCRDFTPCFLRLLASPWVVELVSASGLALRSLLLSAPAHHGGQINITFALLAKNVTLFSQGKLGPFRESREKQNNF